MNQPTYSYPPARFARAAWDLLAGRPRDLQQDAKACIEYVKAELRVLGEEHIPRRGRVVLTINHYHRPGFGAQWIALAVTALVPLRMRWAVTGELMCQGKWYRAIAAPASRIFLNRLASIYGMTTMPPMPPRPADVPARAAAVRSLLRYVQREKNPVLGISPEGHNPPNGALTHPAEGFGRFALLLARAGMRFIPVGGYEHDGIFHVHFGPPYELSVREDLSAGERDRQATQAVMRQIAYLLPVSLRGDFA